MKHAMERKYTVVSAAIVWFILQIYALAVFGWTIGDPEYNAVIGAEVALLCNATPPTQDDSISLVLWFREDSKNPVYSVDARNVMIDEAKHFASDNFGSRAYFNLSQKIGMLHIKPVIDSDGGEYKCRVDFRRGRTANKVMKLNVIVPPEKIYIVDHENRSMDGRIEPLREGSNLNITCEARGGRPSPAVKWWRESNIIDDSFTRMERGLVINELFVPNLERKDLMTVYTCQASNTNLTVPISKSITIDLNLKPLDVAVVTPDQPLSAGTEYKMKCQSSGSRPPAVITWMKGDIRIDSSQETISADDRVTTSILAFIPSSDDHGKSLLCRAENPDLPESALEDAWTMNVHYIPQLSLALGAYDQHEEIREGGNVYFECNIQANPSVTQVGWRFEQNLLKNDSQSGIAIHDNSLRLQGVRRSHRGRYQCFAINKQGEGSSEEVMLRVQFSPVCSPGQKVVYGVAKHENVNITCSVDADPSDVVFQWRFNNSDESIDVVTYTSVGSKSIAKYAPRNMQDYGELYCWGRNSIGNNSAEPCVFTIVPTGPPDPVQNCTITNLTSNAVILRCEAGDDGGLRQIFHLEVYRLNDAETLLNNATSVDSPVFEARGLTPGSSFNLFVYASNQRGRSRKVALTASTLFSAERHTGEVQPVAISAVLAVLMGTVGALVLLAIVIIFIMKTRGDNENRGLANGDNDEKASPQIKKEFDDGSPDVIPSKTYSSGYGDITPHKGKDAYGYRNERIYENVESSKEHTYENIIPRAKYKPKLNYEDITYAELDLPNNQQVAVRERIEPPTEYADIDFQKSTKILPSPSNENEEDDCVQTPLITSKASACMSSIPDPELLGVSPPV